MGGVLESISGAEARSALAWWLEAGVDVAISEQPRDWLKPAPPKQNRQIEQSKSTEAPNVVQPDHATLAELQSWISSSVQMPLASADARRILPHGPEEPAVMLLSDAPALEDFAAGQPIGGDAWDLAQRMLTAINIPADQAYSASLSCFHTPGARMSAADRAACAELARQHIRLVKPRRLLIFGDGPSQALLGKPLPAARGHVHKIEGVRTVATFHPRQLINQPSSKSLAWKDLLLLMEDGS